jgi:hypothetical protein
MILFLADFDAPKWRISGRRADMLSKMVPGIEDDREGARMLLVSMDGRTSLAASDIEAGNSAHLMIGPF